MYSILWLYYNFFNISLNDEFRFFHLLLLQTMLLWLTFYVTSFHIWASVYLSSGKKFLEVELLNQGDTQFEFWEMLLNFSINLVVSESSINSYLLLPTFLLKSQCTFKLYLSLWIRLIIFSVLRHLHFFDMSIYMLGPFAFRLLSVNLFLF